METAETVEALKGAGEYALLLATERMAALYLGWHPPSPHQASF